jgi:hypothetical protein
MLKKREIMFKKNDNMLMKFFWLLVLVFSTTTYELYGQSNEPVLKHSDQVEYDQFLKYYKYYLECYFPIDGIVLQDYSNDVHSFQLPLQQNKQFDFYPASTQQWMNYFATHHWTEKQILQCPLLYMNNAYLSIAKQLPSYPTCVKKYHEKYRNYTLLQKVVGFFKGTYQHNLAQRFAQLHRECEATRKLQEQQERQRQQAEEKKVQEIKRQAYLHQLNQIKQVIIADDNVDYHQHRLGALTTIQNGNEQRTTRTFCIDEQTYSFAHDYAISGQMLNVGTMNAYEHQLHTEFVEQLSKGAQLKLLYTNVPDHTVFLDALGYGVALGIAANNKKDAVEATHWADYCWKVLDIAKAIGDGVALGAYNMIANSAHAIAHPIDTIQTIGQGIGTIVQFFARATGTVIRFQVLNQCGYHEQLYKELSELGDQISDVIDHCSQELAKVPLDEKVKQTTAFATEMISPAAVFKIARILCFRMRPLVTNLLTIVNDEQNAVEMATGAENILLSGERIQGRVQQIVEKLEVVSPALGPLVQEIANSYEHIISAIDKINANRIHHILTLQTGKHAWHKVIAGDITWEKVKDIIIKVMCEGSISPRKTIFKKSCMIDGEIVEVLFAPRSDRTISIVDAWVRTVYD